MDDRWDLENGELPTSRVEEGVEHGQVERGQSTLTGAVRIAMALLLVAGIAIGFAVARISDDVAPSAAGDASDSAAAAPTTGATTSATDTASVDARVPTTRGSTSAVTVAGDLVIGQPLEAVSRTAIGDLWPIALVPIGDGYIVYGSDSITEFGFGDGEGVMAWSSDDGKSWTSKGFVVDAPAVFHSVQMTERGLMAVGSTAPETPALFQSTDGLNWTATELPTAFGTSLATAVAANDSGIVVVGNTFVDRTAVLHEALPEQFRPDEGNLLHLSWGGPPFTVQVQVGLGITVYSATADDLGLSDEVTDSLFQGQMGPQNTPVWVSSNGIDWTVVEIDGIQVQTAHTNQGGQLVLSGYGFGGDESRVSDDGLIWEDGPRSNIQMPVSGPRGSIGVSYSSSSRIVISPDGTNWTSVEVRDLLGTEKEWNFHPVASGPGGFAAVATGYDQSQMIAGPQPISVESGDFTITVDQMRGSFRIERGDEEVFSHFLHSNAVSDNMAVDMAAGTITFLGSDGEPLLSLSLEELRDIEQGAYQGFGPSDSESVLLYSPDGVEWSALGLDDSQVFGFGGSTIYVGAEAIVVIEAAVDQAFSPMPEAPSLTALIVAVP